MKPQQANLNGHRFLRLVLFASIASTVFSSLGAHAQAPGLASPKLVLREQVVAMPKGDTQEVRVLTASF